MSKYMWKACIKGGGQVQHSDSKPKSAFFNSTVVQLKKAGCQTKREELKIKLNMPKFIGGMVVAAAGGGLAGWWSVYLPFDSIIGSLALIGATFIGAIIPSFWVNDYKPMHSYDFHCMKTE